MSQILAYNLSEAGKKHSYLSEVKKNCPFGVCRISLLRIDSFEREEYLIISGVRSDGKELPSENMEQLLMLNASAELAVPNNENFALTELANKNLKEAKMRSDNRNLNFFTEERAKIEQFLGDKLYSVERELKQILDKIKVLSRESDKTEELARKSAIEEEIASLSTQKRKLRKNVFDVEDEIDVERKRLIDNLKKRLAKRVEVLDLMEFKWKLVYTQFEQCHTAHLHKGKCRAKNYKWLYAFKHGFL